MVKLVFLKEKISIMFNQKRPGRESFCWFHDIGSRKTTLEVTIFRNAIINFD